LNTTGVTGTVSVTLANNSLGTTFTGGNGANTVTGAAGPDSITTGSAADTITLTAGGNDIVSSGAGNDSITTGSATGGTIIVDGGAGTDALIFDDGVATTVASMTGVEQIVVAGGNTDARALIPSSAISSALGINVAAAGIFRISVNMDTNSVNLTQPTTTAFTYGPASTQGVAPTLATSVFTVNGTGNNDSITGAAGTLNTLLGGAGNDTITGGTLVDTITGGTGADTMNGGTGNDSFRQTGSTDTGFVAAAASISTATLDKITANAGDTITLFLQTAGGYDTLGTLATSTSITNTVVANTGTDGTVARSQGVYDATAQTFTIGATGANAVLISYSTTNAGTTADQQIVITGVTNVTSILDGVITV